MIVNTKDAAWNIFQGISDQLKALNYRQVQIRQDLTDEELEKCAEGCAEDEILCVHLSTLMCPMHRKEILRWIKVWLSKGKAGLLRFPALIEARNQR